VPCACLILPMGREVEYTVRSDHAKVHMAVSNSIGRLILVALGRDNAFGTSADVQLELSPVVRMLAPKNAAAASIPFLAMADDLGKRERVGHGRSDASGDYVVEDVVVADGSWHRRLVFLADPFAVQSEIALNDKREPDASVLVFETNQAMMAGLQLARMPAPERVASLGLGGGELSTHVSQRFPNATVQSVEWDAELVAAARRWFGFRGECIVADALEVVRSGALREMDALFVDIDAKDAAPGGVVFPPAGFVSADMLRNYRDDVLRADCGVLAMNFSCDGDAARSVLLRDVKQVFAHARVFVLSELGLTNMVLIAWGHANRVLEAPRPDDEAVLGSDLEDFLHVVSESGALTAAVASSNGGEADNKTTTKTKKKKKKKKNT